ncbi:hypothetical protein IPP75_03900 [Candidatus Saccharibacteria bacterium]|nr:MAG: hypothetical protein IPP75_03900 [Candidatus Saccharibacteria bacterium]
MKPKIYLPTAIQCIGLPLLVLLLTALANVTLIRQRFFSTDSGDIALGYVAMVGYRLDNDAVNGFGVFLFWALVGALGYAIAGLLVFLVHSFRSELDFKQYIAPMSSKSAGEAHRVEVIRLLVRSIALAGLIVWVVLSLSFAIPYLDKLGKELVVSGDVISGILLVVCGGIHVFIPILLSRLFLLRARVFGS